MQTPLPSRLSTRPHAGSSRSCCPPRRQACFPPTMNPPHSKSVSTYITTHHNCRPRNDPPADTQVCSIPTGAGPDRGAFAGRSGCRIDNTRFRGSGMFMSKDICGLRKRQTNPMPSLSPTWRNGRTDRSINCAVWSPQVADGRSFRSKASAEGSPSSQHSALNIDVRLQAVCLSTSRTVYQ